MSCCFSICGCTVSCGFFVIWPTFVTTSRIIQISPTPSSYSLLES
jgi:hypothetical protein